MAASNVPSYLEVIAVDIDHLTPSKKELHQIIIENIQTALKSYINSVAILSEEIQYFLAIILVKKKLQVIISVTNLSITMSMHLNMFCT